MKIRTLLTTFSALFLLFAIGANANIPSDLKAGLSLETAITNANDQGQSIEDIAIALFESGQSIEAAATAMVNAGVVPPELLLDEAAGTSADCSALENSRSAQIACLEALESPEQSRQLLALLLIWFWTLIILIFGGGGFPSPN